VRQTDKKFSNTKKLKKLNDRVTKCMMMSGEGVNVSKNMESCGEEFRYWEEWERCQLRRNGWTRMAKLEV
jgi:hypothetical protein